MKSFRVLVSGQENLIREAYHLLLKLGYSATDANLEAWLRSGAFYLNANLDNDGNKDYIGWDYENPTQQLPIVTIEELREMVKKKEEDDNVKESLKENSLLTPQEGLISGADALRALADGKEVDFKCGGSWRLLNAKQQPLEILIDPKVQFRLKPRTITLNGIEIPAPFEPKDGERFYYLDARCSKGYMLVEKINSNCVVDHLR
jgi:hypothetical protein